MLSEKNETIGPREARTAIVTASAATSRRRTASRASLDPTRALKTYKDGNVIASVKMKSAGTFSVVATNCR